MNLRTARSLGLALATFATGCFQGIPEDIPCDSLYDTCPTGYFCGGVSKCVSLEESSPAEMVVLGVSRSSSGPIEQEVQLKQGGPFIPFYVWFGNTGGTGATIGDLKLSAPACYGIFETLDVRIGVNPGEEEEQSLSYDLTLPCEPGTVEVEMRATVGQGAHQFERTWTGSFQISLEP